MMPLGDSIMALAERRAPATMTGIIPRHARRREPNILPLIIDEEDFNAVSPRFKEYPDVADQGRAEDVQASGSNEVASGMGEVGAAAAALAQLRGSSERLETGTSGHPCVGMGVVFVSVGRPPSEFSQEERNRLIETTKKLGYRGDYMVYVDGGPKALDCLATVEEIDIADQVERSFCLPELEENLVSQSIPTVINSLDTWLLRCVGIPIMCLYGL